MLNAVKKTLNGNRLASSFLILKSTDRGKELIEAYGLCLEKQLGHVKKDCCKLEFEALKNEYEIIINQINKINADDRNNYGVDSSSEESEKTNKPFPKC